MTDWKEQMRQDEVNRLTERGKKVEASAAVWEAFLQGVGRKREVRLDGSELPDGYHWTTRTERPGVERFTVDGKWNIHAMRVALALADRLAEVVWENLGSHGHVDPAECSWCRMESSVDAYRLVRPPSTKSGPTVRLDGTEPKIPNPCQHEMVYVDLLQHEVCSKCHYADGRNCALCSNVVVRPGANLCKGHAPE